MISFSIAYFPRIPFSATFFCSFRSYIRTRNRPLNDLTRLDGEKKTWISMVNNSFGVCIVCNKHSSLRRRKIDFDWSPFARQRPLRLGCSFILYCSFVYILCDFLLLSHSFALAQLLSFISIIHMGPKRWERDEGIEHLLFSCRVSFGWIASAVSIDPNYLFRLNFGTFDLFASLRFIQQSLDFN